MSGPILRRVSRGIVAANKSRGTDLISAWPIDLLPELNGELTTDSETIEVKAINDMGSPVTYRAKRSAVLKNIKWFGETNRVLPPDVRRGERVDIWQIGNDDRYYWVSEGKDDVLRRLETWAFAISANPDNAKQNDETNTYRWEWSSHDKHITLVTTMANGERAAWIEQYNLEEGYWVREDEKGNSWTFDSTNTDFKFENVDGSIFQIIKEDINLKCKNFNVDADNITVKSKKTTWSNSDAWNLSTGTFGVDAKNSAELKAGGSVTINGSTVAIN
ncbi:hypothetical protein CZP2022_268 [Vibrio phage C-ZP2022]|nr:hypothetical protein CZP2022_268 [Vibrio phage C-ZP2022]